MEHEFDKTPIPKLVLKLGIPAMCAQFFNILYSIADRAFVGHLTADGEIALAGIGICVPALTAVSAFASLAGVGGASLMSISVGKKDYKSAGLAMNNAFVLLLCLSAVITVFSLIFAKPLLYALGCSDIMYPYAESYFKIYVTGTAAVLCGTGMNQFILAFGNAKRGMLAVIIGAVVNTVLDPVFIYAFRMGIRGAAAATVIAQSCVLLYVLCFLLSDKAAFKLSCSRLDACIVWRILAVGSLPFFIMLLDNLLVILLNFSVRKYGGAMGDRYISCAAVVQSFMVLAFYPAQGITTGCGTIFSYHYGAGHYDKVMKAFRYVFFLCGAYMLFLCIAAQLMPEKFAAIFMREQTAMVLSASCIRKYTLGLLGAAVQYAVVDGLTAMGQPRFALPVSFFRKIMYIACVLLFPVFYPPENVFYAESVSDIIGAGITLITFTTVTIPKLKQEMSSKTGAGTHAILLIKKTEGGQ